jgi:hypothetical protein
MKEHTAQKVEMKKTFKMPTGKFEDEKPLNPLAPEFFFKYQHSLYLKCE